MFEKVGRFIRALAGTKDGGPTRPGRYPLTREGLKAVPDREVDDEEAYYDESGGTRASRKVYGVDDIDNEDEDAANALADLPKKMQRARMMQQTIGCLCFASFFILAILLFFFFPEE